MIKLTSNLPQNQPESPGRPALEGLALVLRAGGRWGVRRLINALSMALLVGTIILATGLAVAMAIRLT
ncbi:hypothetical protein D3C87_1847460 [compost metagenome]